MQGIHLSAAQFRWEVCPIRWKKSAKLLKRISISSHENAQISRVRESKKEEKTKS